MASPQLPPIFWMALPIAGLAMMAEALPLLPSTAWAVALLLAIASTAAALRSLPQHRYLLTLTGFATAAMLLSIAIDAHRQSELHPLAHWLDEDRIQAGVTGTIIDGPIDHGRGYAFDLQLEAIDIDPDRRWTTPTPRLRLFFPSDLASPCDPLPLPGDRIRTWATLERFPPAYAPHQHSARRHMESRGYAARATAREALVALPIDEPPSLNLRLRRHLNLQRIALERRVESLLDDPDAIALAHAMLTGSRGRLSAEFRAPFDITSTGHILAISGLHFAIIAGGVALFLKLLLDRFPHLYRRWPRRSLVGLLTLFFLTLYLLTIGAPISAQRAFAMTALAILFYCFSPWRLRPLSALMATAAAMLLFRPSIIASVGFQLSVTATASILLFLRFRPPSLRPPQRLDAHQPRPEPRLLRWCRQTALFVGISLSATVGTWPILVKMTGELPIAGLWANLIVVPLVSSLLFPLLVVGALCSVISTTLAAPLLLISTQGLLLLHRLVDILAFAPGAVWRLGTPSALEFSSLLIACFLALSSSFRPRAILLASAIALLGYAPAFVQHQLTDPALEIHFIDVDQGDATLIEAPDGTTILVDGGGRPIGSDPGLTRVAPYLRHRGIRRLDAVILTHADYDHYGGLFALTRPFRPRQFIFDADEDHHRLADLQAAMEDAGTSLLALQDHHQIRTPDLSFAILRPSLAGASHNDRSLSVDFSYGGAGVLLAGDLEARGEAWIAERITGRRALLKMPHHGSNTSSTPNLLDAITPALAISSSGRHSPFNHPHPDVIDRYHRRGIDTYGTHLHGTVIASIDRDGRIALRTTRSAEH